MGRRPLPFLAALGLLVALLVSVLSGCGGPRWKGPVSDHFDGQRFYNPGVTFDKGMGDVLKYLFTREPGEWQKFNAPFGPAPVDRVGEGELIVTPINHASVLIQADGLNIVTDPIYSDRASPFSWTGPHRYRPPGIRFEDLPEIDVVLISHNHYDHLDLPTLTRLAERFNPLFILPLGDAAVVRKTGSTKLQELDWQQAAELPNGRKLWSQPCVHWSGRYGTLDQNRSLWMAFVLETSQGPVYFGGDSGYGRHFAETGKRFGPFRLALLPIGAYEPRWLVGVQHINPAEAVQAHRDLRARRSIGIHYGTFELSDVGQTQPPDDLAHALAAAGVNADEFTPADFGRPLELTR